MVRKSSASSQPERRQEEKDSPTGSDSLAKEIEALRVLDDSEIDLTDIPEQLDWEGALTGKFYKPRKKQISLRVDLDVLAWFQAKSSGKRGYQTHMNRALRAYVHSQERKAAVGTNWQKNRNRGC